MQLLIFILIALVIGFWIARSETGDKLIRWFDGLAGRVRREQPRTKETIDVDVTTAPEVETKETTTPE